MMTLMIDLRGVHDWLMTVISVLYVKRMMDLKRTVDVERMMDLVSDSFGLRANLHTVVVVSLMILTTVISAVYGIFNASKILSVFRIRKIFIRIRILGPVSIITDPTCSPAIVNEHYWSMYHISKLKVPIQKFSLPS
jgi:hypothetical protein